MTDDAEFAEFVREVEAFVRGPGEEYARAIESTGKVPSALWTDLRPRGYRRRAAPTHSGGAASRR
jgi:hypothetical protein